MQTLTRHLIALAYCLTALVATPVAAQETCAPPNRCMSQKRINAVTDAACFRARKAEKDLPDTIADLGTCETQRDEARGQVRLLTEQLDEPTPSPVPWLLPVALDFSLVAGGVGTGVAIGAGAPTELVVGLAVLEGALLVGRLVVEWLDRR